MKYSKLIIFKKILDCKKRLIQLHHHSNSGHIGSNLSCLDALVVLHHSVMLDNDRFILSKGHSAGALYITLWSLGRITDDQLDSFSKDDSFFPGHPSGTGIPGLLFPTGSLGHGPSISAGLALASKTQNLDRKIYCLCSDGEWQEGSCWEALIYRARFNPGACRCNPVCCNKQTKAWSASAWPSVFQAP
jgi:transketolase